MNVIILSAYQLHNYYSASCMLITISSLCHNVLTCDRFIGVKNITFSYYYQNIFLKINFLAIHCPD